MNIFALGTGRCGSVTFSRACSHIRNFSSAHESQTGRLGTARLHFPDNHIEIDARLAWFLGRLNEQYGNDAFYVHLTRDERKTAASFAKRYGKGIIRAYAEEILWRLPPDHEPFDVCLDYCQTVNANIAAFLKDKENKMTVDLETATEDFKAFWDWTGAEGDLAAALREWDVKHNESREPRFARWKALLARRR